jgi:hypoxanthine phosphoribosyltransferase
VKSIDFDVIVPVQTTHSKVSLPEKLSRTLSELSGVDLCTNGLKRGNTEALKKLSGKKVLIIDDVVYSGTTMNKAKKAVEKVKAMKIYFIAVASS